MNGKLRSAMACATLMVLICGVAAIGETQALNPMQPSSSKTAEQVYRNIQVLKGVPADQIPTAMQFISASLGVECSYCHNTHKFDDDGTKTKGTARNMIKMVMAINKENFDGRREVTCYSCHHGSADPMGTPAVGEEAVSTHGQAEHKDADAGVTPESVLNHFVEASGGAAALQKIATRGFAGVISFKGGEFPFDVTTKAPNKRISMMHLPGGDNITAFDGTAGWLMSPGRGRQEMSEAENYAALLDAELSFPSNVPHMFSEVRMGKMEKIGDHETYLVLGKNPGQPDVRLYFDKDTGLLARMVRYAESPLGRVPTQIDYSDYRDEAAAKMPYRYVLSRPGNRFTVQVIRAQQNVPVDERKFKEFVPFNQER
jgi:photosynthetic reaction center cytochrome c subunit